MSNESNESVPCIPWFFPTPYNVDVYVCNPWESVKFLDFMNQVPGGHCPCLPDCSGTIYEPYITSTPIRRCDSSNFGVSRLCKPNNKELPQPSLYGSQIRFEYEAKNIQGGPVVSALESSIRNYSVEKLFEQNPKFYDAFEKDIALVEISFRKSTIIQMGRKTRMNWIEYFSTVGGLLGLVLGMGIISFVEILWVCLRLTALKLNFQNFVP